MFAVLSPGATSTGLPGGKTFVVSDVEDLVRRSLRLIVAGSEISCSVVAGMIGAATVAVVNKSADEDVTGAAIIGGSAIFVTWGVFGLGVSATVGPFASYSCICERANS